MYFYLLAFFGLVLRIWMGRLVVQPVAFDQEQYLYYALDMLKHGWTANPIRLYGFPLLIAPLEAVWGSTTTWPWLLAQSLLDITTGMMVFGICRVLFKNKSIAWISYILYLVNPYTSAYTGVLLTEIAAIWFVTAALYILVTWHGKKSLLGPALAVFLLGYLPQIRPSFFYFSLMILGIIIVLRKKILQGVILICIFFIPFIYTVTTNLVVYKQFELLSVDQIFWREVYISNFIRRGIPFGDGDHVIDWPREAFVAWYDFHTPTTPEGRFAKARQYRDKSIQIYRQNPSKFLWHHVYKLFYVWEKHFLYTYQLGPDSPLIRFCVYWGNIVLLILGLSGMFVGIRKKYTLYGSVLGLLLVVYISVAHVFSTSEERFSLPGYPIICVFAGYSLYLFVCKIKKIF